MFLVEVDGFFAVTATLGSTENLSAAVRTVIAFLLLLYPPFCTEFPPSGDGSQYDLLADGNREIIDELAGEIVTLVAPLYFFILATRFNRAGLAVSKDTLGKTAVAYQVFGLGAVNRCQLFFEFIVVVSGRYVDSANAAI